ncbi:MAG: hypothetical protein AAFO58_04440 [Pseudomonadota bacterium]
MEIVYHIGAHATDEDRLLKCLLKNKEDLVRQGISVPGPSRYRKLLRETIHALARGVPGPETRDMLLDEIIEEDNIDRLVMSNSNFICIPARIFEHGQFYRLAGDRIEGMTQLFPNDQLEFHLAIRNPATFIPEIVSGLPLAAQKRLDGKLDPFSIRWSDMIARMQIAAPEAQFTVWCNEDTPLLWAQLIRELSGLDPNTKIVGGFDLLAEIMTPEGLQRFQTYLKTHPPHTEVQKRRIIAAFLDKFAIEDALEEELDMPGWTDEVVDALTDTYEEDVYKIDRMPGVTLITP